MKRTLPVSMYFAFSVGQVFSWKAAQCEQVIEAYSMIETLASSLPSQTSPSGPATARSAAVVDCASALRGKPAGRP